MIWLFHKFIFYFLENCTGSFQEEGIHGMLRPSQNTKCLSECIYETGRWGSSWCYTNGTADEENRQWGAECVSCSGNKDNDF